MKELKYTSDGKYYVFAGKTLIAQSYVGNDGYEVRILQGMNRSQTIAKIVDDCPEFAKDNGIDKNYYAKLFSKPSKAEMVKVFEQYKRSLEAKKDEKTYSKTHQDKQAAANHISKIKKRGGDVDKKETKSGVEIKYSFPK